ncbi:MAG TPA: hypothetical protein ENN34_10110 [Deltaproteobacteria bacterium]|nr:hypothetical protein [Deltaproteobacteria bacterium]
MTRKIILAFIWCTLFLAGCASLESYTRRAYQAQSSLAAGNYADALAVFPESSARGKDEILIRMERAVILQAMGEFRESAEEFIQSSRRIRELEDRAVISAAKSTEQAGTLILSERVSTYEGQDFEKVLIHALNAVNFLLLGDLEGARVEIRNAYRRQDELAKTHARELEQARKELRGVNWQKSLEDTDSQRFDALKRTSQTVQSVYQNAFAYYISALVYELNREQDAAYIDLKKAIAAAPQSRSIQKDLVRLSRALNFRDDSRLWEERFGNIEEPFLEGTDVFVIVAFGVAPVKEALSFPFPLRSGGLAFVSLPVYRFIPTPIQAVRVSYDGRSVETSVLNDTDAIAARNLMDKFPILFAKQVVRSYLKAQATRGLSREYGPLGAFAGTLASAVTEQADLRTWSSLPKEIHVARLIVPHGVGSIELDSAPYGSSQSIEIPQGTKHLIVWSRMTDWGMTIHTQAY